MTPRVAHRVAVIGAGRIGRLHLGTLEAMKDRLQVVIVADPSQSACEAVRNEHGLETTLDWRAALEVPGVEGVVICSATPAHQEQVMVAASAGKHIFCEKPLAQSAKEALIAAEHVRASGVSLQVGFNRRFDPNFSVLAAKVASGTLGRTLLLRLSSRDPEPPPSGYPRGPGGFFADTMVHDFDLVRFVAGENPVEITCFAANLCDPEAGPAGDVDTASVLLRFPSGALCSIDTCRLSTVGYDQRVEIHGSLAGARAENCRPTTVIVSDGEGEHLDSLYRFFPERYGDAYRLEMEAFAEVLDGKAPQVDGRDGVWALALAELAYRSFQEHCCVEVSADDILTSNATNAAPDIAAKEHPSPSTARS